MAPCRCLLPRPPLPFSRACLSCCPRVSPDGAERRLAQAPVLRATAPYGIAVRTGHAASAIPSERCKGTGEVSC